ncbi:hypothetical protein Vadar_010233 [Vaccinium darrowii]|uniref:Uncharacterized protein n=1 Tax=Vaccinium darrowii TaxID=229202 RepID=A0ACB7X8T0_9ERIC|nr:hypothetical protein Vadar_010233 [Vaccinium darrowii]
MYCSSDNIPISDGIELVKKLLLKSKNCRLERLPILGGIDPLKLLVLRSKMVRFGNDEKSKFSSVPVMLKLVRFMLETVPVVVQRIPVQLQRFLRLVRDQEFREEEVGEKVFFQLTRASASAVADDLTSNGSDKKKRAKKRRMQGL